MSSLHIQVISYDLRAAKPETKFILIKLVQLYGWGVPIKAKVKDLASTVGVWDRHITAGIKELKELGYLQTERTRSEKNSPAQILTLINRANSVYQGTNKRDLSLPTAPADCHEALINTLLIPNPRKGKKTAGAKNLASTIDHANENELPLTNKLLLMTLLRYADRAGVVRQLGMKDLEYLTGMNRNRLDNQITRLKALGHIRFSYSGITSTKLFGVSKGGFIIDLAHPDYKEEARCALALITKNSGPSISQNESDGLSVITSACISMVGTSAKTKIVEGITDHKKNRPHYKQHPLDSTKFVKAPGGYWDKHQDWAVREYIQLLAQTDSLIPRSWFFPWIHEPFAALASQETRWYFQMKLYDLASMALSEHWERFSLGRKIPLRPNTPIWDALDRFLPPNRQLPAERIMDKGKTTHELFRAYIWAIALRIARKWHATASNPTHHETGMTYVILPQAYEKRSKNYRNGTTLLCYYPDLKARRGTTIFSNKANGDGMTILLEKKQQKEVPHEELTDIGLIDGIKIKNQCQFFLDKKSRNKKKTSEPRV